MFPANRTLDSFRRIKGNRKYCANRKKRHKCSRLDEKTAIWPKRKWNWTFSTYGHPVILRKITGLLLMRLTFQAHVPWNKRGEKKTTGKTCHGFALIFWNKLFSSWQSLYNRLQQYTVCVPATSTSEKHLKINSLYGDCWIYLQGSPRGSNVGYYVNSKNKVRAPSKTMCPPSYW